MKMWIIAIIVGLLIVSAVTATIINDTNQTSNIKTTAGCSSCSGTCTAEKNCGLSTCSATTGKTCGCKK